MVLFLLPFPLLFTLFGTFHFIDFIHESKHVGDYWNLARRYVKSRQRRAADAGKDYGQFDPLETFLEKSLLFGKIVGKPMEQDETEQAQYVM